MNTCPVAGKKKKKVGQVLGNRAHTQQEEQVSGRGDT